MGSPCSFIRQQAPKMGYFYWLCVLNLNHLHTEISLGYLKDTKFYLESKASFIHRSSIASFKPFLSAWLWEYCTFSVSSVVSLKSSSWPKYTQYETIFQIKSCCTIKLFFLTNLSKLNIACDSYKRNGNELFACSKYGSRRPLLVIVVINCTKITSFARFPPTNYT